jgi:glucose/arabinose dehydrogenase
MNTTAGLTLLFAAATSGFAQQNVPFDKQFNIPVAPTGLAGRKLPKLPMEFDTAEGMRIRVVAVARVEYPSSAAFLPDGSMLVTERSGHLRIIRNGVLDPNPVAGTPASYWAAESGAPGAVHGYMDIALHPRFAQNGFIYLSYTKPVDDKKRVVALARGHWDGHGITDMKDIFVSDQGGTSRIAFGRDGTLFMTTTGTDPQDPNTTGGKVLRFNDDGSIPKDNPFAGQAGKRAEVYTLGHRSALGIAMHPGTGEMWETENGPNGGDEINILKPGANYGWPIVSYGRTYQGPWQSERPGHAGFEPPVVIWAPAIAVSGVTFYTGDKLPKWKGDVFVGSLRTGEIPGTGHVERILFNPKMEELRRESLLTELRQRIRDVRQGPDGYLYVLTDEKEGAVLRIEPAQ